MQRFSSPALPSQADPELLRVIRERSSTRTIPRRQTFLEAEDAAEGVYYIISGRTRHYLIGADGAERILYTLGAGCFFGESECLLGTPLRLYVMAEEETELRFISIEHFHALLLQSQAFNAAILRSAASKTQWLSHEIESVTFLSCKERLLRLLCSLADASFAFDGRWYPLKRNYTLQELGSQLGVSRVTISKLVNEYCAESVLRVVNRRIQVNTRYYYRVCDPE